MLSNLLLTLGISEEEATLYISLLETGPTTVGSLAKKIGRPRPSLYGLIKRLRDKGVVTQSSKFDVSTFSAESPGKISSLFQQKIEDLEDKHKSFKDTILELEKITPSKFLTPKFQLYEGVSSLKNAMKDILLYRDIECQTFWPVKAMVEILPIEFYRYFNKERIKRNIYTRAIWPESKIVDIKKHPYLGVGKNFKRETRIAPHGIDFSMGYLIYKNKAVFLSSRKESFGFIIESKELVEMLLSQFEVIWKLSKPIITRPEDAEHFLKEI